jgi:orotate phosphoribosyltransferase
VVSPEYFDKYRFEGDSVMLREIAERMVDLLPADVDAVAGLELGGVPIATALSQLFARNRRPTGPAGSLRVARSQTEDSLIEDVVTSAGRSSTRVAAFGSWARSSRSPFASSIEKPAARHLARASVDLRALFTMSELHDVAPG